MKTSARRRSSGFTLLEILVVISIIAMLAAILFPAFSSMQERSRQTSCITNLNQIYFATQQYFQDERAYPDSLVDLLPEGSEFDKNGTKEIIDGNAVGYLKGGNSLLACRNDDTESTVPRSSYGALTKYVGARFPTATTTPTVDTSLYVWNYWGYNQKGYAYNVAPSTAPAISIDPTLTRKGDAAYDPEENPINFSLSNRFADPSTIITHCVFHRPQTSENLNTSAELYYVNGENSKNARDIILRLDGSARALNVTNWESSGLWQNQVVPN